MKVRRYKSRRAERRRYLITSTSEVKVSWLSLSKGLAQGVTSKMSLSWSWIGILWNILMDRSLHWEPKELNYSKAKTEISVLGEILIFQHFLPSCMERKSFQWKTIWWQINSQFFLDWNDVWYLLKSLPWSCKTLQAVVNFHCCTTVSQWP